MRQKVRVGVLVSDLPALQVELDPDAAILIGREPEVDAARRVGVSGPVRPVTIDDVGVSANHVVVRQTADGVHALDLNSRNGTWVRLPVGTDVLLGAQPEIALRLASTPQRDTTPLPPPARWENADDFPVAIARAIEAWFTGLGEDVEISLAKGGTTDHPLAPEIPLPGDIVLRLRPRRTVDPEWSRWLEAVWRYVDAQQQIFAAEQTSRDEGMVLASPPIRSAHQRVIDAATRKRRLVLMGPTGAGKEGMARVYHRFSGRSGPFVALDCGQLDREFIRAELFGAEEGAFTGSVRRIVGAVEHANGGTLFLDEIGEMPLEVQPMFLRFLDRGEYTRLGSYDRCRTSNVLVVCASNRDLRAQVQQGTFREDLWYRLSIEVVELPGLAARVEDIVAYLAMQPMQDAGSVLAALSDEAIDVLRGHDWPGNFRELGNFVARLPTRCGVGSIDAATCRRALERGAVTPLVEQRAPVVRDISQWAAWAETSLRAFKEDHDGRGPGRWDDVQEYIERYLKPLLMVKIGGLEPDTRDQALLQKQARGLADALDADRGTALKQLMRYVERYH